jgi:hypothetical protein
MDMMSLYDLKEVGTDFIVITDRTTEVRITFADTPPGIEFISPTKQEHARFFTGIQCQVGMKAPVRSFDGTRMMDIFLDHRAAGYGLLRSNPFPFPVATVEVREKKQR